MANFSANINILRELMDKISSKLFRDFMELENLQNSHNSAIRFAQMTQQRVKERIYTSLRKNRSDFGILFKDGKDSEEKAEYNWLVTPICGFENLVRSIPYFCTTIALEKTKDNGDKETVVALIDNTITKETFFAESGRGAFVNNNRRLRVSSRKNLNISTIAISQSDEKEDITKIAKKVQNIKISNCTALDLAYIASGKYDGSVVFKPNRFDTAAGLFLIRESGGYIKQNKDTLIVAADDGILRELDK